MYDLVQLRKTLEKAFTVSDMNIILFDLGVDNQDLSGHNTGKREYFRNVITYVKRHNVIDKFLEACNDSNPAFKISGDEIVFEKPEPGNREDGFGHLVDKTNAREQDRELLLTLLRADGGLSAAVLKKALTFLVEGSP